MTRLIKDRLNVDIDLVWKSDDYVNKLAMQIVADDLPDIYARLDIFLHEVGFITFCSSITSELRNLCVFKDVKTRVLPAKKRRKAESRRLRNERNQSILSGAHAPSFPKRPVDPMGRGAAAHGVWESHHGA